MDSSKKYDGMLHKIAQKHEGGIAELLDSFFGFLYRKTDFFHGVAAGIPRRTVLAAMEQYENLAEQKRIGITVVTQSQDGEKKLQGNVARHLSKCKQQELKEISGAFLKVELPAEANVNESAEVEECQITPCIGNDENHNTTGTECSIINSLLPSMVLAESYEVLDSGTSSCAVITNTNNNKKRKKQKRMPSKSITPIPSKRKVGRPNLEFDTYRAKHLISLGFTMAQICNTLGISDGTLRRFRNINNDCKLYDKISDQELDTIIAEVKKEHAQIGEKRLLGLLKGRGIRIQRKRLRESIHRVDPSGPRERCNAGIAVVNSRVSSAENESRPKVNRLRKLENNIQVPSYVTGPNSVWRIDSITRLERWKINICFGIDLFSRVIVFIIASGFGSHLVESNSSAFKKAVKRYSWPDSIVTDQREEKELIWKQMEETKGYEAVEISDKLDCVQWITIIKNDLNLNIFRVMSNTFYSLECEGSLNLSNEVDLFCLHFVYLPRINKLLDDFVTSYNACAIPHGSGATPLQVFYAHSEENILNKNDNMLPKLYASREATTIEITLQDNCPISEEKLEDLYDYVRPLEESSDNGKELYYRTGTYVTQYLRSLTDVSSLTDDGDHKSESARVKGKDGMQFDPGEDMFSTDQFNIGQKNVNPNVIVMNKSVMNCPLTNIVSNTHSFEDQSSSSEGSHDVSSTHSIVSNSDVQIVGNISLSVEDGIYEFCEDSCQS